MNEKKAAFLEETTMCLRHCTIDENGKDRCFWRKPSPQIASKETRI
jgi:hypothetical protein